MSQPSDLETALSDILDGRRVGHGPTFSDAQALARISARCRGLTPRGPGAAATARMESRFLDCIEGRTRRGSAWLPALPRTGVQRLAAGAVIIAGLGGGATIADPSAVTALVSGAVNLVQNIAVNLNPAENAGDTGPVPSEIAVATGDTPTPTAEVTTPTPSPEPTETPSPTATPTAQPTAATPRATVVAREEPPAATATSEPAPPPAPEPSPSPSPTASPTPKATVTASPTPTSTPSPTVPPPPPKRDDDDDHEGDDD